MKNANNNGWTPERRARQAEAIRKWKPWAKSTGPKTETGKNISRYNAFKHGHTARGGLKLRAVMAAHSRWLREVLEIHALKTLGNSAWKKIYAKRTNGFGTAPTRHCEAQPKQSRAKHWIAASPAAPRNDRTLQFSSYNPPDSCMVRPHE
jgi:hypothetical protein